MKEREYKLPALQNEFSLLELEKFPIKITVGDIKKALSQSRAINKVLKTKSILAKLSGQSKGIKQLQSFFDSLQPPVMDETSSLLKSESLEDSALLNDSQLLSLIKILIQITFDSDPAIMDAMVYLNHRVNFNRMAAFVRLTCLGENTSLLTMKNVLFICQFNPDIADFAARIYQIFESHNSYYSKINSISHELSPQQKEDETHKICKWIMAWRLTEYAMWKNLNLQWLVQYAVSVSADDTENVVLAWIVMSEELDMFTDTIKNYFKAFPQHASHVAEALVWLRKRGIYTSENVNTILDFPFAASSLQHIGNCTLPVADQDTDLNQKMFDLAVNGNKERVLTVFSVFSKKLAAMKDVNRAVSSHEILDNISGFLAPVPQISRRLYPWRF